MRPDVLTMHRFYASNVGAAVAQLIHARVAPLWSPGTEKLPLYGLGYALPYFDRAATVVDGAAADSGVNGFALMPAAQGVCHWPSLEASATALVDEYHMPVADSSIERMLVMHALEHSDRPSHLFREIWRVLAPGGQVVVVTPNRRRTWSALDTTPFGYGRPYSRSQIAALMQEQMLPLETWDTALMLPPFKWPGTARMMRLSERSIHALGKNLGGALIVSARKQVYGSLTEPAVRARTKPALTGVPGKTG